jgi:hypothetical protein
VFPGICSAAAEFEAPMTFSCSENIEFNQSTGQKIKYSFQVIHHISLPHDKPKVFRTIQSDKRVSKKLQFNSASDNKIAARL